VTTPAESIWRLPRFRAYLGASSATMLAFSMQQLLLTWLLIGVLHTSPERVGVAQAIIGIPGLFLMLWGGASADRVDPRGLLIRIYAFSVFPPLLLLALERFGQLGFWTVTFWALLVSVANSFQTPAQAAILNRSADSRVQEAVTAATAVGFVMQVVGLALAGQLEHVGLDTVLLAQAASLAVGCLAIRRVPPAPVAAAGPHAPAVQSVVEGLRVIRGNPLLFHVLMLNFVSMLFNAGTFFLVFPFLMTKVYGGDAAFLAYMLVVFYGGAVLVNFALLRYMPLRNPGKLFLSMQVTRAFLFVVYLLEPALPLLVLVTFLWGVNMGITTTTSRGILQEAAAEAYRGRILAVYNVGALGAQPLGALVLGVVVAHAGILNALIPALVVSVGLWLYGVWATPIWRYESTQHAAA
jgi:predicted MFS family arabinose efflux permease